MSTTEREAPAAFLSRFDGFELPPLSAVPTRGEARSLADAARAVDISVARSLRLVSRLLWTEENEAGDAAAPVARDEVAAFLDLMANAAEAAREARDRADIALNDLED